MESVEELDEGVMPGASNDLRGSDAELVRFFSEGCGSGLRIFLYRVLVICRIYTHYRSYVLSLGSA